MKQGISCIVVGEGNLLLSCIKELHRQEIKVNIVFTDTENVEQYCEEKIIPCYKANADIVQLSKDYKSDYLFNILNPRPLEENVYSIPRKFVIGYQDSQFPTYADVHATSWAIIRGERFHGINWSVLEPGRASGNILQTDTVEIENDDSTLTLNLKCVEAAKSAFKRLVEDIINDMLSPKSQPRKDVLFQPCIIPPNAGILDFTADVDSVYNLVRGLLFGHHENTLGSPKVKTSTGEFLLVTNASHAYEGKYDQSTVPGTILDIIDDTFVVATGSSSIQVTLAYLNGTSIPPSVFQSHGLVVGDILDSSTFVKVSDLDDISKKEIFWRKKLSEYEPTMFNRQKMNVVANIIDVSTKVKVKSVHLKLPIQHHPAISDNELFLQACFIAFLARLNCMTEVNIGLLADKTDVLKDCSDLFSDISPGIFTVDYDCNTNEMLEKCIQEIQSHKDANPYLHDIQYRYPELHGQHATPFHNIVMGSGKHYSQEYLQRILHNCNILVLFGGNNNSEIEILYHERPAQDFAHVTDVLQHFPTFLNAVSDKNAKKNLKSISLVSEDEMLRFYKLPPRNNEDPKESISSLVEQQCTITPYSIAIKSAKCMMTYKKLAQEIDEMQSVLTEFSCGTDNSTKPVIAVHMPNSIAYVISILAVSRNGMAFLPLPYDLPDDRIAFTLNDAKVHRLILSKAIFENGSLKQMKHLMNPIAEHQIAGEKIVLVELVGELDKGSNCKNVDDETDKDFMYLMYTSGSTGRPKGVKVKESSVINLAKAQIASWDIVPGDVVAQFASIGFDATISEIFTALLSGASLAIFNVNERMGNNFIAAMKQMKVSLITLPPSALSIYSPEDLPSLKKVVAAGEACTLKIANKWTSSENVRFFNGYGPTEATVCATTYEHFSTTVYEDVNRELPIGKAIDGLQIYIFDDFKQPIPTNVVGEIYIGGKGLAHGYIGHASHFTKNRFVQNPLTTKHALLYRTGDLAFQDTDGLITYVGRKDDQVKIRGQRIELSEIEQVLIQHPKIEMATVVAHRCSSTNDLSIAAFVAPAFVYASELKEYLSLVLPKYMIPTYIKHLDVKDLPKTVNGKINRKKLELDESVHERLEVDCHSHLNETQMTVAKYWCIVLKYDDSFAYSLHRKSSFAELGGNSIQLVLLLRLLEDDLKVSLSFTDFVSADTIEEFADAIQRRWEINIHSDDSRIKTENELRQMIYHDSELDADICPHPDRRRSVQFTHYTTIERKNEFKKSSKNILLSGATGFLGAFLLSEILEQSNSEVCCMVRESTEARGLGRLIANMEKYSLWKPEYKSRVSVVISDMSQKNLGISPDIYKQLCNSIDVIFMNAAQMNFNKPYEYHKAVNVEGTKEFIKLASTGVQKYLFVTSTLSVFLFPKERVISGTSRRICYESEVYDDPMLLESGYGQSKWAVERLVMQALDFLPGGAVFRPGEISGRTTDGIGPTNDHFAATLYGMQKMGSYPDMDFPYDLVPVEFCAKAMIEVSLKIINAEPNRFERVYHLFNRKTMPFKELFDGMGLKALPLQEWRKELKRVDVNNKELIQLTPFFMSSFWDRVQDWPVFDTTNIDNLISDSTKEILKPARELLPIYKKFFGI